MSAKKNKLPMPISPPIITVVHERDDTSIWFAAIRRKFILEQEAKEKARAEKEPAVSIDRP
jgi:hypothetical protein